MQKATEIIISTFNPEKWQRSFPSRPSSRTRASTLESAVLVTIAFTTLKRRWRSSSRSPQSLPTWSKRATMDLWSPKSSHSRVSLTSPKCSQGLKLTWIWTSKIQTSFRERDKLSRPERADLTWKTTTKRTTWCRICPMTRFSTWSPAQLKSQKTKELNNIVPKQSLHKRT